MAIDINAIVQLARTQVARARRLPLVSAFLVIFSGNVVAQLILLVSIPVLGRLYEPEAFGTLASLISIVGIVGTVSSLAVERAIPLARYKWQTTALGLIGLSSVTLCAIIAELAIRANFIGASSLGPGIGYLPVAIFLVGTAQILQSYLLRERRYKTISYARIIQNTSMTIFQIVFPLVSIWGVGLVAGYVLGCFSSIIYIIGSLYKLRGNLFYGIDFTSIKVTLKRYKDFSIVQTPSNLITALGWSLPPIIIALLYDTKVAGIYFMSERIAVMPTVMIGQAAAQVFFGESARMAALELHRRSIATQRVLFAIGVCIALALIVFSLIFIKMIFGNKWDGVEQAVVYTSFIVPFMLSIYPVAQFSMIDRQDLHLFWSILRMSLTVSSVSLPYFLGIEGEYSIIFFSISTIFSYIVMHFLWGSALVGAKKDSRRC